MNVGKSRLLKAYYLLCLLVSGIFLILTFFLPFCADTCAFCNFLYDCFGIICHQKVERSFFIFHNQMPLCVRCFGMAIGTFVACFIGMMIQPTGQLLNRCMAYFHLSKEEHLKYLVLILLIIMVPMMADGFIQLITPYQSNAYLRLLTGVMFGYARGVLLSSAGLSCILWVKDKLIHTRNI